MINKNRQPTGQSSNLSTLGAYLNLHLVVLIWGFTAILGKLITIPVVEVVFYRTLIAVITLYFLIRWRGIDFHIGGKNLVGILGTGALIGMHWILFFLAARVSNVSICLAGMATTSLWTSLIEPIFTKTKIKFYEPVLGIIAIIGISVVFDAVVDQWLGFFLAVISALLSAVFTVLNGKLVKHFNHFTITMYEMAGAWIICLIFLPLYAYLITGQGIQLALHGMDFIYLLVLGLICTVFAYSLSVKLMHRLTAFTINLTVNLEPVYGILLALLIFKDQEKMGTNFYIDTSIILISVLLYPLIRNKKFKKMVKRQIFK